MCQSSSSRRRLTKSEDAARGRRAEDIAADRLTQSGLRLVTRNYRCRWGEIDLIMREREIVVFVEVRFRSRSGLTTGAESVDARKQRKLISTAEHYLQKNPSLARQACRFDVVSVSNSLASEDSTGETDINWIRNAFDA